MPLIQKKTSEDYDMSEINPEMADDKDDDSDTASESESELNFLQRLTKRPIILICVYCGIIGYGVFGCVFDWLWVDDMLTVEKGLVFGPSGDGIIITLIIIATVGTISFFFEIADFTKKVYTGEPLLDEDISQMITLFVDEVPSITLSLLLARCREVPMSYYQLAKAALTMFGSGFRAFRTLFHYFRPNKHKWTGVIPWILRTLIFCACVYNAVAACLVWVYTYTVPPEDGSGFRLPGGWLQKSYDNGRYFYKSGVYLSHPVFHDCYHNHPEPWNETRINWIKLDAIYTIIELEGQRSATFLYRDSDNIISWFDLNGNEICFKTDTSDLSNCNTVQESPCSYNPTDYDRITFTFELAEKDKALIFGDIKFNAGLSYQGGAVCDYVTIDEVGFLHIENETGYDTIIAQLQYLQVDKEINDTQLLFPYFTEENGTYRYYEYYEDTGEMNNVTDVWLTGYKKCEMTGALSPNLETSLQPTCGVGAGAGRVWGPHSNGEDFENMQVIRGFSYYEELEDYDDF